MRTYMEKMCERKEIRRYDVIGSSKEDVRIRRSTKKLGKEEGKSDERRVVRREGKEQKWVKRKKRGGE